MVQQAFCHYMVGGMQQSQAVLDVTQAKAMGFDAFALNVISTDTWSMAAISFLFQAAAAIGFHLFFSFDMTHFTDPSQFIPLLQQYVGNPAYYHYNGLPFTSTFMGSTLTFGESTSQNGWELKYKQALAAEGINTYFVPGFSDSPAPVSNIYQTYPVADGQMSWDSAWPWGSEGKANVSYDLDMKYHLSAKSLGKTYMMPMSSFQFKHLDSTQNWYRRGELTLAQRMPQVLAVQPTFLQVQTWNDAGESSYIGNIWPDSIGPDCAAYTDNFSHTGWQTLLTPFIAAFKAGAQDVSAVVPLGGAKVAGSFWYRTILTTATCASDPLGKPDYWSNAEDVVNVAVLLSSAAVGATINVYSGGVLIGSVTGVEGLNAWSIPGLRVGAVSVDVVQGDTSTSISSGTSTMNVAADAAICNYNYQVVALK